MITAASCCLNENMRGPSADPLGRSDPSPLTATRGFSAVTESGSDSEAEEHRAGDNNDNEGSRKRRKKSSLKISCELCKSRKVKCDRAEPSCGWCTRNNRTCVYSERKRPGYRASYGERDELDGKINRVEALLQVLGRRLEDHIAGDSDHHDAVRTPSRADFRSPGIRTASSVLPDTITPTSGNYVAPVSTSVPSTGPDAIEIRWSNAEGYDRLQEELRAPDAISVPSKLDLGSSNGHRPAPSESDLPPYDLSYTLVDLYFKHVNPWCPILDRAATLAALFQSSGTLEASDSTLLHAIIATTLRFSEDPRLTSEARSQYHAVSKAKVQQYGLSHANVRSLQSLVILAVDVLGQASDPEGWGLLALIAQNVTRLGLSTEKGIFLARPSYPSISSNYTLQEPTSWIDDEGRRRLYWMVYVLDRYATLGTAFDFILDDKESTRALPCRYDLFSRNEPVETRSFRWADRSETIVDEPDNLGSFSYHCEVLRILSRIHQFLRRPVDIGAHTDVQRWRATYRELDSELNTWIQNLPGEYGRISQLCHSDPASRVSNWIMLHAAYVTSVVRLHSSFAYPIVRSHIFQPSYHAIQRCLGAVKSLKEIAQDAVNTGMLDLLGHPFAFSLWVSARLLLVHAAAMECEVDPMVQFFLSTLHQLGQYWPVARNYAEILHRVVQESQQPQTSSEGMMTLTAMRR